MIEVRELSFRYAGAANYFVFKIGKIGVAKIPGISRKPVRVPVQVRFHYVEYLGKMYPILGLVG